MTPSFLTAIVSAGTFILGSLLGVYLSAVLQKRGEKERRVWEARRNAYARLTARLLRWEPALPTLEELRAGTGMTQHLSLEEILADFSEGILVAEKPMAALLFHFAHLGARLDAANEEM
jgi:hypothetical protein